MLGGAAGLRESETITRSRDAMEKEGECETEKRRLIGNECLNWQVQLFLLYRDL